MMAEGQGNDNNNSDRRVANLQGLLNFCTEVTAREDSTQETSMTLLSQERKEFLENVMREMQCDTSACMASCLQKLNNPNTNNIEEVSEKEVALDQLADLAEDINYAIVLEKLKGFPIIVNILRCSHPSLQRRACQLIGDICQNNEVCQKSMLSLNTMQMLLNIIDKHEDEECKVKALYALSCLTRDFEQSEKEFADLSGFCYLMRAIQTSIPKLTIKAIFLLNYFTEKTDRYKDTLISMGFIEQLVAVLFGENVDNTCREYCTLSLLNLASSYNRALVECRRPEFSMISQLKSRKKVIAGKEEFEEEENHISSLLNLLECGDEIEENMLR